jgi:hypothetical protein
VPHFHRLHADDEGVRQRREEEQGRRGAADGRLPAREVDAVRDARRDVQDEGKKGQRAGA